MNSADFAAARRLEDIRFSQHISEAAVQREKDIRALQSNLAAKGLLNSGPRYLGEVNIFFTSIESIVEKAIACRKELGIKVPALLTPPNLKVIQDKLDQIIDGGVNSVRSRLALEARNAVGAAMVQEAQRRAFSLKAKLKMEIAALPLEVGLGMHHKEDRPQVTTLNISHSTVANLNLGTVVGDLNSSIQSLAGAGQNELVQAIRQLSEAISGSSDLDDSSKKDLLEHLAPVSGEAAQRLEKRKMGLIKTSINALKSGLAVGTQLLALWQGVEHALKAIGILPQ